jgi:hypothetical protein
VIQENVYIFFDFDSNCWVSVCLWILYRVIKKSLHFYGLNMNCCFSVCDEAVSSPHHVRVLQWNVLSQGAYMLLWGGGGDSPNDEYSSNYSPVLASHNIT